MKPNRTLSYIGIAIVLVIGLLMIVGAVLPKDYRVARTALVAAPPQTVYEHVVDLKMHEAWTPWKANDDTMVLSFGDPWVGEGAVYTWTSEDSGDGTYTITAAEPWTRIDTHIVFTDAGEADGSWSFEAEGDGTRVTWSIEGAISGILGGYYALIMDGAVGPTVEDGLARLAAVAEAAPPPLGPIEPGPQRGVLTLGPDEARLVRCGEDRPRAFRDDLGEGFAPVRARASEAAVRVYVELEGAPVDGPGIRGTRLIFADLNGADDGCDAGLGRGAAAAAGADPGWAATFGPDGLWIDPPDAAPITHTIVASSESDGAKSWTAREDRDTDVILTLRPGSCSTGGLVTSYTATLAIGDARWDGCGRRGLD